uniref:Putative salivary kunitz domain protein n=1 Tax=Ixodes ricinus TaxID=34613 RepID=A0A0K8RE39_IXORI
MQKNILWIVIVAAFGVCHCDDNRDDSRTDDSSSSAEGGSCNGSPYNPVGRMNEKGWFYDPNRDECRNFHFGNNKWEKGRNKFQTLTECGETCRSNVPLSCFATPHEDIRTKSFPMFWYNSKHGVCEGITASKDAHEANVFRNTKTCNNTCRDPELGKCAPSELKDCSSEDINTSYYFDGDTKTCNKAENGKCGPFTSLEACFQRCGRYIPKKCHMPALTSKYCDITETRYWYNSTTNKCEEIKGCIDDVTNFRTAADCWKTCSSEKSSRCLKPPDLGRARVGWTHYYYNITDNKCQKTTHIAFWQNISKKNNFKSLLECMEMCKPTYEGVVKKL